MRETRLSRVIAPVYGELHRDIREAGHLHYWIKGGRGSGKSSFAALETLLVLAREAGKGRKSCAMVLRRYSNTLRESVVAQLRWATEVLGVEGQWEFSAVPLQMTHRITGQKIYFKGTEDGTRLKSLKAEGEGFCLLWYEETTDFEGWDALRSVNQSLLRGELPQRVLYTYNPPRQRQHWLNRLTDPPPPNSMVLSTTYLDLPPEWLGPTFLAEADALRQTRNELYRHEYLGEITGMGGEVFRNLVPVELTQAECDLLEPVRQGVDWGYAVDPFHYLACSYDPKRRIVTVFEELRGLQLSNRAAAEAIRGRHEGTIWCDSAEPKSIDEMRGYGLRVKGAPKAPGSRDYGIKFLQDCSQLRVDVRRCPAAWRELNAFSLTPDREGGFLHGYPQTNDHSIDALRYALWEDMSSPRRMVGIHI